MPLRLPSALLSIFAIVLLGGCAARIPQGFPETAVEQGLFGEPPGNPNALVEEGSRQYYYDPTSIIDLRVFEPVPVMIYQPWGIRGHTKAWCGYVIPFEANAKNRLGAYTGLKTSYVYVRHDEVHDIRDFAPTPGQHHSGNHEVSHVPIGGDFRHYYRRRGDRWVLPEG
jgi:hypothetical protein